MKFLSAFLFMLFPATSMAQQKDTAKLRILEFGQPVDHVALKKIYDRYSNQNFEDIAVELATKISEANKRHLRRYNNIPSEQLNKPWTHSLSLVLSCVWKKHTSYTSSKDNRVERFETLMKVLDTHSVGREGRSYALSAIKTHLYWKVSSANLPEKSSLPLKKLIRLLQKIATDNTEADQLRLSALPLLFQHSDPNEYLHLAIQITDKNPDKLNRSEVFRFSTEKLSIDRLNAKNRAVILHHVMDLLKSIDNGKGTGYFLSLYIGHLVKAPPVKGEHVGFKPDQSLEKYRLPNGGLHPSYFQDTVENAKTWWKKNKRHYPLNEKEAITR